MNYFLRMLSTVGWIWAGIFGLFLMWKLKFGRTADSADITDKRE
jgi:hypothetical protein